MRLVSLNCWGGRLLNPLIEFFENNKTSTDIFCLQEVFSTNEILTSDKHGTINLYEQLENILKEHQGYFAIKTTGYDYSGYIGANLNFGNAIFIKKNIPVTDYEELFEPVLNPNHDWSNSAPAKAQLITINLEGKPLTICNYHGVFLNNTNKKDTPERIDQSFYIKKELAKYPHKKILCGDFNLLPDGQSIKILEQDMNNLITDYKITSTRADNYVGPVKYADYVLVSNGIQVQKFKTAPEQVSDHLALQLDFTL